MTRWASLSGHALVSTTGAHEQVRRYGHDRTRSLLLQGLRDTGSRAVLAADYEDELGERPPSELA